MLDNLKFWKKAIRPIVGVFGFGDMKHSYNWTRHNSLSLYEKSLYANKAISKRAEKVGEIKFVLKNKAGKEVFNEWTNLLDKPNPWQTGDQFWQLAQKYYDIVGSCYILKKGGDDVIFNNKKVNQLELLRADLVEVVLNEKGNEILAFDYHNQGNTFRYLPDEIIYLYRPDPRNPLLGESLLASAVRNIETEVQISEYHANVLKNGGRLESIFKVKDPINEGTIANLQAQYEEKYAEAKQAGRPLFLGGDIDIEKTALSPMELAYLDTKVSTLNDISIATGVPKAVLGSTGGETFANADASIRIFLRETIKPQLSNIVNILNWRLIPDEFELEYIDPTPEDQEEKRKNIETAYKVNALKTNEIREMLGYDTIPEGESIMIPFNLVELGKKEEVRTPKEEKSLKLHPLKNKDIRKIYAKQKDALMTKFEDRMLKEVRKFFDGQKERLFTNMGESRKRKNIIDDAFNTSLEIKLAKEGLVPVIREIFIASGQDTAETFNLPAFNFTQTMENSIQKRAEMFSESIINTTSDQLQRTFSESFSNNESRQELVVRIENLYGDISVGRAEVIARTEVHSAMQDANLQAYARGGLETKIWVTVGDDRVRDEHASMDGEEAPLYGKFSNGLEYPSEPNCRCTI